MALRHARGLLIHMSYADAADVAMRYVAAFLLLPYVMPPLRCRRHADVVAPLLIYAAAAFHVIADALFFFFATAYAALRAAIMRLLFEFSLQPHAVTQLLRLFLP